MENNEKSVAVSPQGAVAVPEEMGNTVVLAGDPEKQMEYAVKSARVLVQVLKQKPKKVMINGEQYLEFEDWQTLGRFYGATVGIEWTRPIEGETRVHGYEAKAVVMIKGEVVSSAEAMCTRDERNWANRDEFALRSMAQTRASAKALRNVLAWVAVLGGFKPTPIEEMPSDMERTYVPNQPSRQEHAREVIAQDEQRKRAGIHWQSDEQRAEVEEAERVVANDEFNSMPPDYGTEEPPTQNGNGCATCGAPVSDKVRKYSLDKYGRVLCYDHQRNQ
jgi:hypothetical protein